jgi:hypothetical protein
MVVESPTLDYPPRCFLAAVFAHAVDLESVPGGFVVIFVADLLLKPFHFIGEEFD